MKNRKRSTRYIKDYNSEYSIKNQKSESYHAKQKMKQSISTDTLFPISQNPSASTWFILLILFQLVGDVYTTNQNPSFYSKMPKNKDNNVPLSQALTESNFNQTLLSRDNDPDLSRIEILLPRYRENKNLTTLEIPQYKGLYTTQIPNTLACRQKTVGVSSGKVCSINGNEYYLKTAKDEKATDRRSDILLAEYNLRFVNKLIKVKIPETLFLFEESGTYLSENNKIVSACFYLGSKFVKGFKSFSEFQRETTRNYRKSYQRDKFFSKSFTEQEYFRKQLVENIGEIGISKLAVAGIFIYDLTFNPGNWGLANNELVILDADLSPHSIEDYYRQSTKMPTEIGVYFSFNNLVQIKDILENMVNDKPPLMHEEVDMPISKYNKLVTDYLQGCNSAINTIKQKYPNHAEDIPDSSVNTALGNAFHDLFIKDFVFSQSALL